MKKLDTDKLKVGDIILTSDPNKTSRTVRRFTNSDISHAMIYVATCSVMDSTNAGVRTTNTQRIFFAEESLVLVLRLKEQLTKDRLDQVTDYARSVTGTDYSRAEAVAVFTGKFSRKTRRQFCSRLVAQAYASAGVLLVLDPDYCSPENLRTSALLDVVEDVLLPASLQEKESWERHLDIPSLMSDCTKTVMEAARKKNGTIRSLNDINDHLIQKPEDDVFIKDAFESSGFLTVWQKEYAKNQWHYALDLLRDILVANPNAREEIIWYCTITVSGADDGRRYEVNRRQYADLATVTQLQTFGLLANLYERLDLLHKKRVSVATQWLAENAPPI